jgi:tetratricopeptide (TPR) repeat protein
MGRRSEAEIFLQKAVSMERHDSAESRALLAELYLSEGRYSEAEAFLRAGLRRHPESWRLKNALGILHIHRGDKQKAIEAFSSTRQNPDQFIMNHNARVATQSEKVNPRHLIGSWQQKWISDYISRSRAAMKRGELETARDYLEKILATYPEYVPALSNLGIYHLKTGHMDYALKIWEKARELDPGHRLNLPL